jgi:DNA-directed RNA polymerase II subunit RPB1
LAGVASKSNVTRGVPRLKELLKATKNPKATSLTVYLKKEYRNNKEKARELAQDLELTLLRDICDKLAIYYDPNDENTTIEEDKELLELYNLFELSLNLTDESAAAKQEMSKWLLRVELNREKMFEKNITMNDVAFIVKATYGEDVSLIYSDYNSQKLVMRIRMSLNGNDLIDDLKKFQNKLLNNIILRGVPGIRSASFVLDKDQLEIVDGKYQPVEQFVLITDGSNFTEVMNHPYVEGRKLYSTHIHDIYEVLGKEATRGILMSEIKQVFKDAPVNYRHLGLLCDVMTRNGKLMSVDRSGINKNDIGPLAKASFEETVKILLKASLFGEMDPITGVSANIMTGQCIRGGTSFSQILLDEPALERMLEGLPPVPELDTEDDSAEYEAMEELIYDADAKDDACARTEFQMSLAMPTAVEYEEEPEVEMMVVDE